MNVGGGGKAKIEVKRNEDPTSLMYDSYVHMVKVNAPPRSTVTTTTNRLVLKKPTHHQHLLL